MFGERQTRELLGPADPARALRVPSAGATATDLIHWAEAAPEPAPGAGQRPTQGRPSQGRPTRRRLVLVAVTATAVVGAAAVAYPLLRPAGDGPAGTELGAVAVPIAYQLTDHPPPAGEQLRELAARVIEAPYEQSSGEYAYFYRKSWGDIEQVSPEGYRMSHVEERELWLGDDGPPGRERVTTVGIEFPDAQSRRYFESLPNADQLLAPSQHVSDIPAGLSWPEPLPTDRAELAERLGGAERPSDKLLVAGYQEQLLPWQVRAAILEILADAPGFVWRGEVTDRAGRAGVAVSRDDTAHAQRSVLVFDPQTGELLAHERVDLSGETPELMHYSVIRSDRTDQRPELTAPDPGLSPSPGA